MAKKVKKVSKSTVSKVSKAKSKQKKSAFQRLFEQKPHIEFFVALLSIPFFMSVILINFNTLRNLNKSQITPTPEASTQTSPNGLEGFYAAPIGEDTTPEPTSETTTGTEPCEQSLGPISIKSPGEGDTVSDNPVNVVISYDDREHCDAAWSYRINGGSWSAYDDRSVALYNLPNGEVVFELRAKSIVADDEKTLKRTFQYEGNTSDEQNASNSAN